jgi:general L-amino acid transport system permease protein
MGKTSMTATTLPFPPPSFLRRWLPTVAWTLTVGGMAAVLLRHIEGVQTARGVQGGFGFLFQPSGFRISESLLNVTPDDPYWMSIAAGLVNTLTVATVAIVLATLLGIVLGLMRLSANPLAARGAAALIAPLRNTPVLLQLFVWYGLLLRLPDVRQAWSPLRSVLLSNRGLALPALHGVLPYAGVLVAALALAVWARRRACPPAGYAVLAATTLLACTLLPAVHVDLPVKRGLGLQGGWQPSIEFVALLIGLTVFHAAYIADIVRAAVRAVPLGLVEAGQAMGLTPRAVMHRVIAPYAVRVALPPYANQCLALVKNSTLAIAIGYQELMAVINTAITQTGLALEGIALAVAIYLGLALLLGGGLSAWNARHARHGPGDTHGPRLGDRPLWNASGVARHWRGKLGRTALTGLPTVALTVALAVAAWALLDWAVVHAVWQGDATACADAAGACWAAVGENLPLLIFGTMAPGDRGPALVACVALVAGITLTLGARGLPGQARAASLLALLAIVVLALSGWPWGGTPIGPQRWGGLLVTLILAIAALTAAVPLAFALALLRRSGSRAGSLAAAGLIEAVRGVPLVTQLLFASFVLPMLWGGNVSKFSMALAALTLHTACLLAEVLRGALQAIPPGQMMAARALGMRPVTAYATVIWPQARRIAAPAALGVFVGAVKDTSLVSIIGVFDVLGAAKAVVAGTDWRPYHVEVYLAVAMLYFGASLALSRVASRMETRGG